MEIYSLLLTRDQGRLCWFSWLCCHAFNLLLSSWNFLCRVRRYSCLWHWACRVSALTGLTYLRLQLDLWINLFRGANWHAWVGVLTAFLITLSCWLLGHKATYLCLLSVLFLYRVHGSCCGSCRIWLCFNQSQWVCRVWLNVYRLIVLVLLLLVRVHDLS